MKARISFDLDLSAFPDACNVDKVREVVTNTLIEAARAKHVKALHGVRTDGDLDMDVKAIRMGESLKRINLTLMAEASLEVVQLSNETEISNVLPFERP